MKKVIAAIVSLVILFVLLPGCREKELTPIEKAQARAVEIGEQFLNYEITGEEARKLLNSIKVPAVESGHGQLYLDVDIGVLAFLVGKQDSTYEEIEEKVNYIAERNYLE